MQLHRHAGTKHLGWSLIPGTAWNIIPVAVTGILVPYPLIIIQARIWGPFTITQTGSRVILAAFSTRAWPPFVSLTG